MSSLTEGDNADNTAAAATAVSTEITSDASDISSTSTSLDNSRINAPHPSESSEADTLALMAEEVQSAQKDSIPPLVHEFVDSSNSAPAIPSASDNDHAQHIQQQQRQQEQLFEIENSTLPLDLSSSVDASSSSTDPPQNETATPAAVALLVSKDEQQQQQQQQHQNSTPNGNDDDEEDDEEYTSEYQPTILEDEEESEQANEEKVQSAIDRVFKAAIPSSNDTEDGDEKFVDTSSAVLSPPVIDIGALILDSATTNSTDGSAPPELNHLAQLNSTSESDHRVYTALKNGSKLFWEFVLNINTKIPSYIYIKAPIHSDGSAHAPILPIGTYNELNHNTIQKDVEATAAETAVADALSGTRKLSQVAKYGVAPSAIEEAYTVIHATASLANSPMKQKIAAAISTTRNSIVRSKNSSRVSSAEHSRRLSGVGDGGGGGGGHSRRGSFLGFIRITDNETGEDGFAEFSRESTTALEGRRASQYRHTRSRSSATLKESVSEMGVPLISYSPTNRTRLIPAKYVAEGESNIPRYVMSKKKATPSMNCGADETGSETGYTKDIGTATSTATAVAASSNARPTFAKDRPMSSGKDKKLDGIVQKGKTVVSETKMMEMIKTDTIASSNNNEKGAGASSKKGHLVTVITKSGLQTECKRMRRSREKKIYQDINIRITLSHHISLFSQ